MLIGDPAHAKEKLGCQPTTTLEQLCAMMVEADLRHNAEGRLFQLLSLAGNSHVGPFALRPR